MDAPTLPNTPSAPGHDSLSIEPKEGGYLPTCPWSGSAVRRSALRWTFLIRLVRLGFLPAVPVRVRAFLRCALLRTATLPIRQVLYSRHSNCLGRTCCCESYDVYKTL